jgi:outer membrane protein assembly factor BamE (lipoprotein component of BamABCDE complex)
MKPRALIFLLASLALLAGCASAPPAPGTTVSAERVAQVVPGLTTKSQLLATLGKTTAVVFDSGFEAWLYTIPAGRDQYAEFVVLLDPQGVVSKTRQRAPAAP